MKNANASTRGNPRDCLLKNEIRAGRRFPAAAVLFALLPLFAGAAGAGEHYRESPVEQGGTVTGRVFASRAAQKVERFIVPKQTDICGGNYRDSPIVTIHAGVLRHVVVYLEDVPEGKPFRAAAKKVTINQAGCWFVPFLSVLMDGGELEAVNSDPLLHNIHIYELLGQGRSTVANVSQPRKGDIMTMSVHLDEGMALKVECDAHDFMHAFVFVADNPYYALVRPDGSFEIENVPPGRYAIHAWHPYLGEKSAAIEVEANGAITVDFSF
ncbi:MAG: hypothetical protein KAR37_16270 [Alphaproteobacteria bacterium]|nr:hypothetical protein [Alphaproteobacteria bacterium]